MPSPNQRNQQQSTGVAIPINLVHETIDYLESHGDPKAVMLKQHYQQKVGNVRAAQTNRLKQFKIKNYEFKIVSQN